MLQDIYLNTNILVMVPAMQQYLCVQLKYFELVFKDVVNRTTWRCITTRDFSCYGNVSQKWLLKPVSKVDDGVYDGASTIKIGTKHPSVCFDCGSKYYNDSNGARNGCQVCCKTLNDAMSVFFGGN